MPRLRRYRPHRSKPPVSGARVDWSRPLARGLRGFYALAEGSGTTVRDATGNLDLGCVNFGASNPWGAGPSGVGIVTSGAANTAGCSANLPARLRYGYPLSIACAVRIVGTPNSGGRIFGMHTTNTTTAPFAAITFYTQSSTQIGFGWASGSSGNFPATYATIVQGLDYVLGLTVTPTSYAFYVNGVKLYSGTGTYANPGWTVNALMMLAGGTYTFNGSTLPLYWGAWWDRALTPTEHAAIGVVAPSIFGQITAATRPYWFLPGITPSSASMAVTLAAGTFAGLGSFTADASMAATLSADVFAGVAGGSIPPLSSRVDPARVTVIDTGASPAGVDPSRIAIIQ